MKEMIKEMVALGYNLFDTLDGFYDRMVSYGYTDATFREEVYNRFMEQKKAQPSFLYLC